MRGGEGVINVEVAEPGHRVGQLGIVLLLAAVEAGILQHRDIARLEQRHHPLGRLALAIVDERHVAAEHVAERMGDEREAHVRVPLAFRTAEMGEDQDDCPPVGELGDGRRRGAQAGIVGHPRAVHRHVQVLAHEHPLSPDLAHVVECLESSHIGLSILPGTGRN